MGVRRGREAGLGVLGRLGRCSEGSGKLLGPECLSGSLCDCISHRTEGKSPGLGSFLAPRSCLWVVDHSSPSTQAGKLAFLSPPELFSFSSLKN